jgi:hypothetical protein
MILKPMPYFVKPKAVPVKLSAIFPYVIYSNFSKNH